MQMLGDGLQIVSVEEVPNPRHQNTDDIPSIAINTADDGEDGETTALQHPNGDHLRVIGGGAGGGQMEIQQLPHVLDPLHPLHPQHQQGQGEVPIQQQGPGDPDRASWGGKMEFMMTCIGYAVGLGNVWRFPFLCYKNGGGAFLIPYTIMLFVVGLPLFFMELAFGQFASLGPITVWRINPLFKGLGYAMVSVSWLISLYYNVIIAQVLFYLFASFTDELPWTTCDNWWNTDKCYVFNATEVALWKNASGLSNDSLAVPKVNMSEKNTAAEEYYREYVLRRTSGIEDFGTLNLPLAGCLLLAWAVVGLCLLKGVQSLGKVVYFTALFPYCMLTVLLVRGLTLDGSVDGIIYYVQPDFARLADPRVWSDAATQIFYSLSACAGGLICMSSFNKFNNNCHRDAVVVALLNCSTSIFAGFVIFSILGFMAHEKNIGVGEVAKGGPGLAFEVYPEALSRMVVAPMWAVFFFLMMATLGFGSQFSLVECVMSSLLDEFPSLMRTAKRTLGFRISLVILAFLLGLPMVCGGGIYLLELVDYSVGGFPLLVVGVVECIALNWIYGFDRFWGDIKMMIGERPKLYWKCCWLFISPGVICLTTILNIIFYKAPTQNGLPLPGWAEFLGWMIVLFPISAIFGWLTYYYCKKGGFRLLKMRAMPLPQWGPALAGNRKSRYSAEVQNKEVFGTVEYQMGGNIYRSHLKVNEIAKLLSASRTSINTQVTPAGSTTTLNKTIKKAVSKASLFTNGSGGAREPTPATAWGSNVSV